MEEQKEEVAQKKTGWQSFWELARFAFIALLVVVPVRAFVAEPFVVSGNSMVPTFEDANYLIVDKISYILGDPKRDDVVIFRYPKDQTKFFIKRIIGLPGETVDVKSSENKVTIINKEHPDGFNLTQPFIKNIGGIDAHTTLGSDEYFVMGDNRSGSSDSRYWGAVKKKFLVGRAFLRLLPIQEVEVMPGNYKQAK
ncbi:signal peptidase I [Candidatus Nomurabacteria bacterium RIFCSPLOWO2_01_FULL_40_18]|uniref:Signal peptidase I n=1 Tax=Candidatus Nomurabacteria bacterium RIFCSPLOWO2_01_FULL_40_18 TaxID=1801773 RepID=A0A1F6XIG1_9BACT|nr:MAG: signal peptidase I [Candidatus Nomurabacteria bacterium RIFCSPLOWO2_01_FULL_40_18]